ncbi:MAG TPA: hypothetical protein VN816_09780 [Acidimicrobiales bacterium]|nr:hypothetical protein [Acidimicrobiales bacterium]
METHVSEPSALSHPGDHGDAPDGDAREAAGTEPSGDGAERILLNIGSSYFHDGRVGPERYASDMAPTFLAVITASHSLLREFFTEMGAVPSAAVAARCDDLELRYGATPGEAQLVQCDVTADEGPSTPTTTGADATVDEWVRGVVASRDGDNSRALSAFESEAEEAVESGSPQRAAIAYRSASAAARAAGRADDANRLLRLAGKAYLDIAELSETIPQGVFMAFREGARCFLDAGNLPLAHKCLSKAIAIGETLGYTESK